LLARSLQALRTSGARSFYLFHVLVRTRVFMLRIKQTIVALARGASPRPLRAIDRFRHLCASIAPGFHRRMLSNSSPWRRSVVFRSHRGAARRDENRW